MRRLNVALFVLLALVSIGHSASAQNAWAPCLTGAPNCVDNQGATMQITCQSIKDFYSDNGKLPYLKFEAGSANWICPYLYAGVDREQLVLPQCYSYDLVANPFVVSGCSPRVYPRNLGKPDRACDSCGTNPGTGEPISIAQGSLYAEKTDYSGGDEADLTFTRYYNTRSNFSGTMGWGWHHGYERYLVPNSSLSPYVLIYRKDGELVQFNSNGSGGWTAPSDFPYTLTQSGGNFILKGVDDSTETYNSAGKLLSIARRDGYTQTLTYSGTTGLLSSVSDSFGRALNFGYDANRSLTTMTDPNGKGYGYAYQNIYSYASAPLLYKATYPDQDSDPMNDPYITYLYENTNNPAYLTGVTDELGHRYATWTYDNGTGRATISQLAGGVDKYTVGYNADGTRTVWSPLGEKITYTFLENNGGLKVVQEDRAAIGTIPAAVRTVGYDSYGFQNDRTDWNGVETSSVNNARGLQTSRTEAAGTAQARTITTDWSSTYALPTKITEPRLVTDYTYDANGNMLTRKETDTTAPLPYPTRTWTYTYTSTAPYLLKTVTGPRTDVTATTTYNYSATTAKTLSTIVNALGQTVTFNTFDASGRPLTLHDANNTLITLTYDALGRITSQTIGSGSGAATTTITYNKAGLVYQITTPDLVTLTYAYDNAQRLTSVTNGSGEKIEYTIDNADNITQTTIKSPGGSIRGQQGHTFDALNRLLTDVGYAAAQVTTYGYDANGNRISSKDARGNITTTAFDALNRLVTVIEPISGTVSGCPTTTSPCAATTYDAADNVTAQSDFRGKQTTYSYNGFRQLTGFVSPDAGATGYVLDKAGNRISETDARGITTTRTFDKLNRVLTETYTTSTENVTYAYDSTVGGNVGIGHLTSVGDTNVQMAYVYDARSNVTQKTAMISGKIYTVGYAYDLGDKLTQITYPSGRQVQLLYNAATGSLKTINTRPSATGTWVAVANPISREPWGPVSGFTYGNGLVHTRSLNKNYWPNEIKTVNGATAIQDLLPGYDNDGNVTALGDAVNTARNQTFTIDALDRVTAATGSYGSLGYSYDYNGNRLTATKSGTTETYGIQSTSNRLYSSTGGSGGARSWSYNGRGDITNDTRGTAPDVIYAYSKRARLAGVTVGGTAAGSYLYDAFGQRASKVAGSSTTHYVYDESGRLLAEANGTTGATTREYVWLDMGTGPALPIAQIDGTGSYYLLSDQLGTPQKLTNAAKAVVWDRHQQPFGEDAGITGATPSLLRFPGQYTDPESALNDNWMRQYDPTTGRYVQYDPAGVSGQNPYAYVESNPLSWTDPEGKQTVVLRGLSVCAAQPEACAAAVLVGTGIAIGVASDSYGRANFCEVIKGGLDNASNILFNDKPYENETPADKPQDYEGRRGSSIEDNRKDGSVWDKDRTGHGGSRYKRWPNERDRVNGKRPESVREDGSVR